jgi:hypothetical protein
MKITFFPKNIVLTCLILSFTVGQNISTMAQEEEPAIDRRPVRATFESVWIIDNQTVMVPIKGTFEMDIQHRFGTIENGYNDFFGLYAPSNIRIGFHYTPFDRINVGFGFSKFNLGWDGHLKYALFQQTRSGSFPFSITYYLNMAVDTRDVGKDSEDRITLFRNTTDRLSYFHQIIIARKFSPNFSFQVAPSVSHFNIVEAYRTAQQTIEGKKRNDHFALAASARLKFSDQMAFIANYDLPFSDHPLDDPKSNIAFGIELSTSSHAFQLFLGNFYNILPQSNNFFNRNDPGEGDFLIGFNITRLWNF